MSITPIDADRPQGDTIRTRSGLYVNPLNLQPSDIRLSDMAYALAHVNRYGGHTIAPYSVAEHSLYVAAQLDRQFHCSELTLLGLLHDAPEAYLGDIVAPLKRTGAFEEYREAEFTAEMAIAEAFECWGNDTHHRYVKDVDHGILAWEMAMFRDVGIRPPPDTAKVAHIFIDRTAALYLDIHKRPLPAGVL